MQIDRKRVSHENKGGSPPCLGKRSDLWDSRPASPPPRRFGVSLLSGTIVDLQLAYGFGNFESLDEE